MRQPAHAARRSSRVRSAATSAGVSSSVAALRADQQGLSTFPEFVAAAWRAGVLSWTVDLVARTCTYRSASGRESYVESYPAVELP